MQLTRKCTAALRWPLGLPLIAGFSIPFCADTRAAFAQGLSDVPAAVRDVAVLPIDELLFDDSSDGAVWARGASYKARFGCEGAMIVPFFGSDAPRNYPLELRVRAATLGEATLDLDGSGAVTRVGDTVRIDRGQFVEEYVLTTGALEQRFLFDELRGAGDLVVRMDVASELAGSDLGSTLRFENELGRVDYGEAYAIDADGQRIGLDSRLVDGALELRVPASFVASAALPLVIDPLVTFFTVSGASLHEIVPDVSYDVTTDRWCAVWTSVWSVADHDAFARLVSGAGALQPGFLTIDFTSDTWVTPKIANDNAADVFLVCAAVVSTSGVADIRGRFVLPGAALTGAPFSISAVDGAYRNLPDIGGNPIPGGPGYFGVVWQRWVSANDVDVEMQLVRPDGTLQGGPFYLEQGASFSELPSISNSVGASNGTNTPAWTIVWQHRVSATDHDIRGAQVGWAGNLLHPNFPIALGPDDDTAPCASTLLDPVPFGPARPYLVAFQRKWGTSNNIFVTLMQGTTKLDEFDLTIVDGAPLHSDQFAPSVDSDGAQFLIGYVERSTPTSTDGDVWIDSYYVSDDKLIFRDNRRTFAGSPADETDIVLHSMAASGGPRQQYFGTWAFASANNGYDVQGGLWQGFAGGWIWKFCSGDGSGAPCPCGNTGGDERGCANSASAEGAELSWTGDASLSAETLVLRASGLPANANCLFFQGTTAAGMGAGVPFGDGKRCAIGVITRLALKTSSGGSAVFPEGFDAPISVAGQISYWGGTRYYQAWYRDPSPFCTSEPYNLTNGVHVIWAP